MVIHTKVHFVNKYYSDFRDPRDGFVVHRFECSHREPFGIKPEEKLFGFNFCSAPKTISATGSSSGSLRDYSEMFYFGKRYTCDELIKLKRISDANFLKECGVSEGIFCDNGSIVVGMKSDDKTIDELKRDSLLRFGDFVNVDRMTFFNGLVSVFGLFEDDVSSVVLEKRSRDSGNVQKEFTVSVDGVSVFKESYDEALKNGLACVSTIKFSEAFQWMNELSDRFPYLEKIADEVALEVLGRGNPDFDIAMADAAIKVAESNNMIDFNSVLVKKG